MGVAGVGRTHSALCAFCGAYFQAQRNFIDNPKCCCTFKVCVCVCVCASVCVVYAFTFRALLTYFNSKSNTCQPKEEA